MKNEEWEDVPEEPKDYWFISDMGQVHKFGDYYGELVVDEKRKEIGNYFETKEEAEKAVEKLKAWKRLKEAGFEFDGWTIDDGLRVSICTTLNGDNIYSESEKEIRTNLDLVFGGEDE